MALFLTDLQYCTPDADGTVKLNRGMTKSDEVPFPSFVGDVRFYRGLAEHVGVGQLRGWQIVAEISAGTLVRIAMSDAEVGVVSGSNALAPTAVLALNPHSHGIQPGTPSIGDPDDTRNDLVNTGSTIVASRTHHHPIGSHAHGGTTDPEPGSGTVTITPLTLNPQAVAFYLIEFVGVAV